MPVRMFEQWNEQGHGFVEAALVAARHAVVQCRTLRVRIREMCTMECREVWSAGPGTVLCILGLLGSSEARLERNEATGNKESQ
ncbi:MAG: hypothetical protein NVS4B11_05340 [Ktedonobacteraceae bacterium]